MSVAPQPEINTSTNALETRLDINRKYSSVDFQSWLIGNLRIEAGMDILDVGCGTGAQARAFLSRTGPTGSVSAVDISASSVQMLRDSNPGAGNLRAAVADMDTLADVLAGPFAGKRYDLAQSTYALYYAVRPDLVLDAMRSALKPDGRLAVCVPYRPHGLVELLRRFGPIPKHVDDCNNFAVDILEPYFRQHYAQVSVSLLRNTQRLPSVAEAMSFLRNAAYFNPTTEQKVEAAVAAEIADHGVFSYDKHSYLIVGCVADAD